MSNVIDERVVEMRFDNKQFESATQQSMSTLEKLKAALKFDGFQRGFRNIDSAANAVNMSGLSTAVQTVSDRFSAMEVVAITALANITNKAVNAGTALLKSVSVDQVAAGWQKYGEKSTAVGTLISQGYDLETVNDQMEKLNWFTDETSYNFVDMSREIGKFTATGQGLEDSVQAMMGIANWAALSGQNATKASMAMYQLSQAMGKGALRYDDWKSIQNASMDTLEFRNKALEAAEALGNIQKVGEEAGEAIWDLGGATFTTAQMFASEALTRGMWFDKDVMMSVFKEYSSAVDDLYEYAEENGVTASEAMEVMGGSVDAFGLKAFKAAQEARTWADVVDSVKDAVSTSWMKTFELIFGNYEESVKLWTDMANGLYDIFAQPINNMNEVLAGWNKHGGRLQLFAGLKNILEDINSFLDPIKEAFSEIFPAKTWQDIWHATFAFKTFTAQLKLSEGAQNGVYRIAKLLFSVLKGGTIIVKAAFRLASRIVIVLFKIVDGVLSVIGNIGDFVQGFIDAAAASGIFEDAMAALKDFFSPLSDAVKNLGTNIDKLKDKLKTMPGVQRLLGILEDAKQVIGELVGGALSDLLALIGKLSGQKLELPTIEDIAGLIDYLAGQLADFLTWADQKLTEFKAFLSEVFGEEGIDFDIVSVLKSIPTYLDAIWQSLKSIKDDAGSVLTPISSAITSLIGDPKELKEKAEKGVGAIVEGFNKAFANFDVNRAMALTKLAAGIYVIYLVINALRKISAGIGDFGKIPRNVSYVLREVGDTLIAYQDSLKASILLKIAGAIGILALSIIGLSFIPSDTLTTVVADLLLVMLGLALILKIFGNMGKKSVDLSPIENLKEAVTGFLDTMGKALKRAINITAISALVVGIAVAITLLAVTFSKLGKYKGDISKGIGIISALALIIGGLASILIAVNNMSSTENSGSLIGMGLMVVALAGSIAILAGVLRLLKGIKLDSVGEGLAALGIAITLMVLALASLTVAAKMLGKANLAMAIASILSMTVIFGLLTGVILTMQTIKWEKVSDGLLAVGIALGEMVAALVIVDRVVSNKGGSLLALGALTAILIALTYAVKQMAGIRFEDLIGALGGIAVALGLLIGSAVILQYSGAAAALVELGLAVALMGVGLLAGGVAILAFGEGVKLLASYLAPLGEAIVAFSTTVIQNGSTLATAFSQIIKGAALAIVMAAPNIAAAGIAIIMALAVALKDSSPTILTTLGEMLMNLIDWLGTAAVTLINVLVHLVIVVLNGLAQAIMDNADTLWFAITNVLKAMLWVIVDGMFVMLQQIVGEIPFLSGKLGNYLEDAKNDLKEYFSPKDASDYSTEIMEGAIWPIEEYGPHLVDTAGHTAEDVANAVNDPLKEGAEEAKQTGMNYQEILGSITSKEQGDKAGTDVSAMVNNVLGGFGNLGPGLATISDGFNGDWASMLDKADITAISGAEGIRDDMTAILGDTDGFSDAGNESAMAYFAAYQNADAAGPANSLKDEAVSALASGKKDMAKAATDSAGGYVAALSGMKASSKKKGVELAQSAVNGARSTRSQFESTGAYLGDGVNFGLAKIAYKLNNTGRTIMTGVINNMRNVAQVASPSKVTTQIGKFLGEGLLNGLNSYSEAAEDAGGNLSESAIIGLKGIAEYIKDVVDGNLEMDPTIRPVLDATELQNGIGMVNTMFGQTRSMALAGNITGFTGSSQASLEAMVDRAVNKAMDGITTRLTDTIGKQNVTIDVPLYLDGREVARVTAPYTRTELNKLDTRALRKEGIA